MASKALFLRNGRLLTMAGASPIADAVLAVEGRIVAVGSAAELAPAARAANADDIDLRGRILAPGFIDAHIHLLAYAAKLVSVDCGPDAVSSIADIKARIGRRAAALPAGAWVRAAGYDELALAERRHPTRRDLDAAAPDHPVRLLHRSGHAVVLNSRALALAGIDGATPEPPGGFMDRDLGDGEPTGLLIEMNELVDASVPALSGADLRAGVTEANRRLLGAGVTCVQDAGAANGLREWQLIRRLVEDGALTISVSMMEGYGHMGEVQESEGPLRRGVVKIMPRELEHDFYPPAPELALMLRRIDADGRRAAVHAVTRAGLEVVLEAFEALGSRASGHRIEHCGVCGPEQAARIARLGLTVVTQPGFLRQSGDLMLRRLPQADLQDLYPLRRLLDAGVRVAGSSDAPVIDPDVLGSLRAAVERRTREGADIGAAQTIAAPEALQLFTTSAAAVLGVESERGRIAPGLAADFAVLNQDPAAPGVDWGSLRVEATIVGGQVVYEA